MTQNIGQLWPQETLRPGDVFIAYNCGTAQNPRMGYIQAQQQQAIEQLNALQLQRAAGSGGDGGTSASRTTTAAKGKAHRAGA